VSDQAKSLELDNQLQQKTIMNQIAMYDLKFDKNRRENQEIILKKKDLEI
jgi:hypothetical protein